MDDLISRSAAIDAVRKEEEYYERSEDYDCMEAVQSARWRLEEVPVVNAIPLEWLQRQGHEYMQHNDKLMWDAYAVVLGDWLMKHK